MGESSAAAGAAYPHSLGLGTADGGDDGTAVNSRPNGIAGIDLPTGVHGSLMVERLPAPPRDRLRRKDYDAVVAMLDQPPLLAADLGHMEAAEQIIQVAQQSLANEQSDHASGRRGRSSALLLATGPIGLREGCRLVDRLAQSFVQVRELGFHRRKFGQARRCLAILHHRAERQHWQQQQDGAASAVPDGGTELGLRLQAERLVDSWLEKSSVAASDGDYEAAADMLCQLSKPKRQEPPGGGGSVDQRKTELRQLMIDDMDDKDEILLTEQMQRNPLLKSVVKAELDRGSSRPFKDSGSFLFLATGLVVMAKCVAQLASQHT